MNENVEGTGDVGKEGRHKKNKKMSIKLPDVGHRSDSSATGAAFTAAGGDTEKKLDSAKTKVPQRKDTETTIPEPLSGDETANIVSEAYEIAGPRIGSSFVEANVVLTLAGARGQTEFFIDNPTDEDVRIIEELNKAIEEKGISMQAYEPFIAPDGTNTLMVNVMSLRGLERVSKLTKIRGFSAFEASAGWDGAREWNSACLTTLEALQADGKLPFSKDDIFHVITGVNKGYPDVAIYDAVDWSSGDRREQMAGTDIPHVSLYGGAEPNFDYAPKHEGDPSIQNTVASWGKVLENFYNSSWHRTISKDTQFLQARAAKQEAAL
jgi:hypothetical protein